MKSLVFGNSMVITNAVIHGKSSGTVMINLTWQTATLKAVTTHSPLVKSFQFTMQKPWKFTAGQHCAIRLTSPDGYQVARDYSLSSLPSSGTYEITVEKIADGEVSGWLHDYAEIGDSFEVIGPVGGFGKVSRKKLLLIAGNVGITPFASMLRQYPNADFTVLWSITSSDYLCFKDELSNDSRVHIRETHHNVKRYLRADNFVPYYSQDSHAIIVGSAGFVFAIKQQLALANYTPQQIAAETFFDT